MIPAEAQPRPFRFALWITRARQGVLISFALALGGAFLSCKGEKQEAPLRIAAAANVREALGQIASDFQEHSGYAFEIVSSSSGKLSAQIREGAPFDLLISADQIYPQALFEEGLTAEPPRVYAQGRLVLWSATSDRPPSPQELEDPRTRKIALAQPDIAPYGRAARQALEYYSLYQPLEPKLVYGESVAQVNQFVSSGAAEYGFTSLSTIHFRQFRGQGRWALVDSAAYEPIFQAACLLKPGGAPRTGAIEFYAYLFSDSARRVFQEYGYATP